MERSDKSVETVDAQEPKLKRQSATKVLDHEEHELRASNTVSLLHEWNDFLIAPMSYKEKLALGKKMREEVARDQHGQWKRHKEDRRDPLQLLASQDKARLQHLIPFRYGRMMQSPFAFYRGAALVMASDLSHMPQTNLVVELCGDCHLSNFGLFATPERNVIFDINDFDETLPGPFEWDLKRLATSFAIAATNNSFTKSVAEVVSQHFLAPIVQKWKNLQIAIRCRFGMTMLTGNFW